MACHLDEVVLKVTRLKMSSKKCHLYDLVHPLFYAYNFSTQKKVDAVRGFFDFEFQAPILQLMPPHTFERHVAHQSDQYGEAYQLPVAPVQSSSTVQKEPHG